MRVREGREVEALVVVRVVTEGRVLDIPRVVGRLVDFGILESLPLAGSVTGV